MKYFIPEWDDRVDPDFDFINDQHSQAHDEDQLKNDYYMWDIFGVKNVPFDGVLVSIATIQEKKKKYKRILEDGIHDFLRLPNNFEIMADCGAFTYINENSPPYSTSEVLKLYSDLGFNYGVSIDHIVVPMYQEQSNERMRITYENGIDAFDEWSKKYRKDFQLIVAVQGETVSDYVNMYNNFLNHNIKHLAFGGLVRSPTPFLKNLIDALIHEIQESNKLPEYLHFFGLARCDLFSRFQHLEELGIKVAFDSASYLRKAWLSSPSTELNYITPNWKGYSAIRIPMKLSGKKKNLVQQSVVDTFGAECLMKLRQYDQGLISIDQALEPVERFINVTSEKPEIIDYYRRTLNEQPWKKCPCPICNEHGIEVLIFRGNNRNRRRGFHNTWVFYQVLKDQNLWNNCIEKNKSEIDFQYIESLESLKKNDNILIITGCTKRKIGSDESVQAPAKDMYLGRVFRKVREYSENMGYDYAIISAKYGLLFPDDIIGGYEKVLKSKEDIEFMKIGLEERLSDVIDRYDQIIVIAGLNYRKVLEDIWDERFIFLKGRGIGDIYSIVAKAIPQRDRSLDEFL